MKEVFDALENKRLNAIDLYPKYEEITNEVFAVIEEMLDYEYKALPSDVKRLRAAKKYLYRIVETAFNGTQHKNYMLTIVRVFKDSEISSHICRSMGTKKQNILNVLDVLESRIIYWQGYEGNMEGKLQQILGCIRF